MGKLLTVPSLLNAILFALSLQPEMEEGQVSFYMPPQLFQMPDGAGFIFLEQAGLCLLKLPSGSKVVYMPNILGKNEN